MANNSDDINNMSQEDSYGSATIEREVYYLYTLKSQNNTKKFSDDELQFYERNYYNPYRLLKPWHWGMRVEYLVKEILDYWIKRENMREGQNNFIKNNEYIYIYRLNVIGNTQDRL